MGDADPWYMMLLPKFLCDLDCGLGGTPVTRQAPFLYDDDEIVLSNLPARMSRPRREDAESLDEIFLWEVLDEMNELRCNPRRYAEQKLAPLLDRFDGKTFEPPPRDETADSSWRGAARSVPQKSYQPPALKTHEGAEAVREALKVLRRAKPARALGREAGMDCAARDHALDLTSRPAGASLGHVGTDGTKPADRLTRYGQWYEAAAEMLTFRESTAAGVVASLVICDGAKSRNERKALLNDDLRVCGLAVAPHRNLECIIVVTAAVGYGPRPIPYPARVVTLEHDDAGLDEPPNDDMSVTSTFTLGSKASFALGAAATASRPLGPAFEAVLYSIPLPHVHDRILTAIRDGARNVFLDYAPPDANKGSLGRVHVSISWGYGSDSTRFTAQWR